MVDVCGPGERSVDVGEWGGLTALMRITQVQSRAGFLF